MTVNVQGASPLVRWSLNPSVGTLQNGLYTAPSTLTSDMQVTISATSLIDPSQTATATVALLQPVTPISITLSGGTTALTAGKSTTFIASVSGTANTSVSWSVSPELGTINNGIYTAPSGITSPTTVTITATSQADPTKTASTSLTVKPPSTAAEAVSISLSPLGVSLQGGQSATFTSTVSGASNTSVIWTLSPQVGTIDNGVYQAPAIIASAQGVTVTASSAVDAAKSASATVNLIPVSIAISPGSVSLDGGQSATFHATVSGSSNTSVNWSLNPAVGTITGGVYQAPATIASAQTVTITAASAADSTKTSTATVALVPAVVTVAPASVSLAAGKSATFSASLTGATNTAVTWSLSPQTGTIANGVYTAPATIPAAQQVTVTATSVAYPSKTASALVSLIPTSSSTSNSSTSNSGTSTTSTGTVTLPLEVIGPAGTTASATVTIPSGASVSGQLSLAMTIHGLKYDTEASVQVNNSAWFPLSTGNVTILGNAAVYGGIGGGFHTLPLLLNLPAGVVVAGNNTITFRFNGTNGIVSGFRVLAFNIQSAGTNLVPSSEFVEEDPNTWQPPSTAASDIAAGQSLWHTAALTTPGASGATSIHAHCADCHSEDGRDLKYFNYSNNSIEARAVFHGLTAAQGAQIASYIRSLDVPNPGRPWNPPYQPGPGLDSQPVANWSAGAGLSAVLDSDAEMQPYMLPGGSTATWAATSYLNIRELPIPLQLPDWNSWLPVVHPMDAYGASFTGNGFNTYYQTLHGELQPNSASSYTAALSDFIRWYLAAESFLPPLETSSTWTPAQRTDVYSVVQWRVVKQWELNQEFGLEGMPQVVYGAKANPRGWYGNASFETSPFIQHIPAGPGLGNGTNLSFTYLSYIWYHMELILNDGQGQQSGQSPIDYSYTEGEVKTLSIAAGGAPAASLELMWLIKSLQEFTFNGKGPQYGTAGFVPTASLPFPLANSGFSTDWSATSPATEVALTTDYVQSWFTQISTYTVQQWYAGTDGDGRPWATATENPGTENSQIYFGGMVWYMLPRLRWLGVDPTLLNQVSAWAATVWPAGNWALNNAATCTNIGTCTSDQ